MALIEPAEEKFGELAGLRDPLIKPDPTAMYLMSLAYYYGTDRTDKSESKSYDLCRRAAEAGHPFAMGQMGFLCATVKPQGNYDRTWAERWTRQAADQGVAQAAYNLGCWYEQGLMGLPYDKSLSAMWHAAAKRHQYDVKRSCDKLSTEFGTSIRLVLSFGR